MLVRGDRLKPDARREVLAAYVYRWTVENYEKAKQPGMTGIRRYCPTCKQLPGLPDNPATGYVAPVEFRQTHPTVPLVTDAEWLREHAFRVTRKGSLDSRATHCFPAYLADAWDDETMAEQQKNDEREAIEGVRKLRRDWHASCKVED